MAPEHGQLQGVGVAVEADVALCGVMEAYCIIAADVMKDSNLELTAFSIAMDRSREASWNGG
jgi:hypothetical protein